MTTNRVNFSKRHDEGGWAKYLPAISGFYTTHLGKALADENFVPKDRIPAGFEYGLQGLNFLDKDNSYFNYKYALYSAGHAERNLSKCDDREPMIHKRDRKETVLIGDSGGFQIATGVIKLDWKTVKGPEGDKLREEILRYLEYTSDWSMTLDVPAFAAEGALSEKTGLTKFSDTLDVTLHNLNYFMKHRVPGATKFLNVLSGSSPETSKEWFDAVIPYSIPMAVEAMGYSVDRTLEGYAFAGVNMRDMSCVLERILDLRELDALKDKDWIHFLGIGRLDWACYLTSIERCLRKHDNPNINISFDAASPFVAAGGYALCYDYNYFSPQKLTYSMGRGLDNKSLKGSKLAMPFQGPIMERLKVGDICVMGPDDRNKHDKIGKTSWDTTSYALVMAHNVYNHIQAIQEVNRLADIDDYTKTYTYQDLIGLDHRGNKMIGEHIPAIIPMIRDLIRTVLDPNTPNPRELIRDYAKHLAKVSFKENKQADMKRMMLDSEAYDLDSIATEDADVEIEKRLREDE
jgi:hypothetical protein